MPGLDEEAALGELADDLVGGLDRREAVQPAVVVVEAAGLVDRRQHRQAERPAELEVLAAAAGRDVDDAGALLERDLVPRHDAVLDRRARARGRRTARGSAGRRAPRPDAPHEPLVRDSARPRTHSPFSRRPYSASGLTAAATFAGSVHGVVVQTTTDSPGRSSSGKRTKSDGSLFSW